MARQGGRAGATLAPGRSLRPRWGPAKKHSRPADLALPRTRVRRGRPRPARSHACPSWPHVRGRWRAAFRRAGVPLGAADVERCRPRPEGVIAGARPRRGARGRRDEIVTVAYFSGLFVSRVFVAALSFGVTDSFDCAPA